ncbi:MAG: hypothetical protein ACOYM3_21035 [Terrimicrobiaceae bacterium]
MTKIKSLALSGFFALALVLGVVGSAQAGSELDFTLVNKTGYGIKEIYIAPSSQEEWSDEDKVTLPHSIQDDTSVDITFSPKNTAEKWDLKIIWVDGGDAVEWQGFDLTKIEKITLHYNEKTEKTTAETE